VASNYIWTWLSGPGYRQGLGANAFLWSAFAALFFGFASAEALRWLVARRRGRERAASRRSAAAIAGLSLALLAATALIVLPPKRALLDGALLPWAAIFAALGLVAGLKPAFGAGLTALACALAFGLVADALSGWIPAGEPATLSRLFPFSEEGGRWKGEFIIFKRDSVPTTQGVEFTGEDAGLVVELAELSGPATLVAGGTWYRLVGLADSKGRIMASFPARESLLGRLEPLAPGAIAGRRGLFLVRRRETSPALKAEALQPMFYSFVKGKDGGLELAASRFD
jgi:hypothetical protein